jgi:two-component system chemotaxis response regulator CheB
VRYVVGARLSICYRYNQSVLKTEITLKKARIQILHDHVLVRQMLSDVIHSTGRYEIVGLSPLNTVNYEDILKANPNILLVDVNDEHRYGLQLIKRIHELNDEIEILALSGRTRKGASDAFEALEAGAIDYITTTERPGMLLFAENHLRKRMLPVLRTLSDKGNGVTVHAPKKRQQTVESILPPGKPEVLIIGGCIGGPMSMLELAPQLDAEFPIPVLVTLHMPKLYTEVFAEQLDQHTELDVALAEEGEILKPGQLRIAPGGFHLIVKGTHERPEIHVHRGSHENRCRPSIDALFRSAAEVYGNHVVALVLSGRGKDGVFGAQKISDNGGTLLLIDPTESIASELIEYIIEAGVNYQICKLPEVASTVRRLIQTVETQSLSESRNGGFYSQTS